MALIIGVKFKEGGKMYYFSPGELEISQGDKVIVETSRGTECGDVVMGPMEIPEEDITAPLKTVLRKPAQNELRSIEKNKSREKDAYKICEEKIARHGLDMNLIDVEIAFDNSKILFYFTADGRVDFRELVKDLAATFKTRIELRQIGVRDEAKLLGGLGICGRPFCCRTFLRDFQPVSIKMAKEQSLSLNPTKISGTCGRLMCCLKYEQDGYEELLKITPRQGSMVDTPDGVGFVEEANLLTGQLKVKNKETEAINTFSRDDVKQLKTPRDQQRNSKKAEGK